MIAPTGQRLNFEIARQSRLASDIARSQIEISTGKRIQRPSDDPVAAARVAVVRRGQADAASWSSNLELARALASDADTTLAAMSERVRQAQESLLAGASGTASVADRKTYAAGLRGFADEIDALVATTSSLGTPLFAQAPTLMRVGEQQTLAPLVPRAALELDGRPYGDWLRDAAAALEAGGSVAPHVAVLSRMVDGVADAHAAQGVAATRIDSLLDRQATHDVERASELSRLQDTNIAAAVARLNGQTLTLEAAQAAFARINRRTLFDILG